MMGKRRPRRVLNGAAVSGHFGVRVGRIDRKNVLAVMAAAMLVGACGPGEPESISAKDRLVVGVRVDLPGLSERLPNGAFRGYDIDVARYLAGRLGVEVEFVPVVAGTRESTVLSGKADLIIATFSITQERKTRVSFAGPYLISHQDILVRTGDQRIRSVRDLKGRTICAVDGSVSPQNVISGAQVDAKTVPAKRFSECLDMLRDGTLDAISTDDVILAAAISQDKRGFKLVNAPFTEQRSGVAIRKGDVEGCEALNRAITDMYQDGTAKLLLTKWFGGTGLKTADVYIPQFEGCE
jgi:glutamate transport system substrate-binding protein